MFTQLDSGTYDVSVRDDNGCTQVIPAVVIAEPFSPVEVVVDSVFNASCNDSLGRISVSASGGVGGYDFFILGNPDTVSGLTNYTFDSLAPSSYLIFAVDTNGCNDLVEGQIIELTDPLASLDSLQDPSCYNESTGYVEINMAQGTPPYSYSLDGAAPQQAGPGTVPFDNLSAGFYDFLMTDQNGCNFTLKFELEEPDTLLFQVGDSVPPLCAGESNGQALFLGFGGTRPYRFQLTYPDNSNAVQDTGYFDDLVAGEYIFTLLDTQECVASDTFSLSEPPPVQAFATVENISCPGEADGVIRARATGGTPRYEYAVNGSRFGQRADFPNRTVGDYNVLIQDDNGCRDSLVVTILEPDSLDIEAVNVEDVSCFGENSGRVTVGGSGGTAPYEFASAQDSAFTPNNVIGGLRAGSIVIVMRDANGCLIDTEVDIAQPDPLRGEVESQPVICFGDENGSATAAALGGTPPYRYRWSNNETGPTASQLPPGNPFVVITDANDCEYSISAEVIEPPQLEFDTTALRDVTCFGGSDGFLLAVAEGGTPPYDYEWSGGPSPTDTVQNNVSAGEYIITVRDSNRCPASDTLIIEQPTAIDIDADIQDAICGTPSGVIRVTAQGGVGPYEYEWNTEPPQLGPEATGLLGGPDVPPYVVVVTDADNCEFRDSIALDVSGEPSADFLHAFQPLDSFLIPSEGVQFVNRSIEGIAYEWDFGDDGISNELNPLHVYQEPGTYDVTLVVFDPFFSCPDTFTRTFTLLPPGDIFVPTGFTPNGDGTNDFWGPKGIGVVRAETRVYSRWGGQIALLRSLDDRWNGVHARTGQPVQEGVYIWVVEALLNDGTRVTRRGTVTLVR